MAGMFARVAAGLALMATLAVAMVSAAHAQDAQATNRIALIIANEAYTSPNLGRLPGSQADASVMSQALTRAGFAVKVERNLTRAAMQEALSIFARDLQALGPYGVGFLYYSGHGMADGPRGRNYLIPVDAHIRATTDLPVVALALDDQLAAIELAGAGGTVFVIDACRNTPISLTRSGRGFAPMNASTDTLIAFSTAPGEIAEDDGFYARTLAEEMAFPGVDISTVFQRVQVRVAEATKRKQRPRYDNGLLSPLVMVSQLPALSAQARAAPDLMPPEELAALGARSVATRSSSPSTAETASPATDFTLVSRLLTQMTPRHDGVYAGDEWTVRFLDEQRFLYLVGQQNAAATLGAKTWDDAAPNERGTIALNVGAFTLQLESGGLIRGRVLDPETLTFTEWRTSLGTFQQTEQLAFQPFAN